MKLIFRHRPKCIGINIFKWRRLTIALWYIPRGISLPYHKHPGQDIELIPLWFKRTVILNRFKLPGDNLESCKCRLFKSYSTPDGYYHFFSMRTSAIIYLNIIKWKKEPINPELAYENLSI